jgi:hypothetical protein
MPHATSGWPVVALLLRLLGGRELTAGETGEGSGIAGTPGSSFGGFFTELVNPYIIRSFRGIVKGHCDAYSLGFALPEAGRQD